MTTYTNTEQDDLVIGDLPHVKWVLSDTDSSGAALVITDSVLLKRSVSPQDDLTISDEMRIALASLNVDTLHIVDAAKLSNQVFKMHDRLFIRDNSGLKLRRQVRVLDDLTIGDEVVMGTGVRVVDTLTIGDELHEAQTHTNRAVDAMTIGDLNKVGYRFRTVDALTIGDELQQARIGYERVQDDLTVGDELSLAYTTVLLLVDGLAISDEARARMSNIVHRIADSLCIEDFAVGGGPGVAWASHAELMAMSRYTNYPFTSMDTVNGYRMATGPLGVYLLAGDDDAGANIDSVVQHDLADSTVGGDGKMVTDPNFKRPRYAYGSYKSEGALRLRLGYVDIDGTEQTASYDMPAQDAEQFITGRIDLGRGIRSRYMRPALLNVDGAPFSVNDLKLVVDSVKRKI